jgi:galactonate dehydratase
MSAIPSAGDVVDFRENVAAIREAAGPDIDIAVDCHGRVSKPVARRILDALEVFDLMFVEEPLLPEHLDALGRVTATTTTPIATGERLFHRTDFKPLLEAQSVDVVQPDLSHAGGITECKRIADVAAAYDVAVAPHCPLGPIALASCLQVDAVCHNFLVQEQIIGDAYDIPDSELLTYVENTSVFEHEGGSLAIPDQPGLGVEIDTAAVEAAATDVGYRTPVLRCDDGSVLEW